YDDDITFKLVNAVSEEMNMNIDSVFIAFGEWWVLKTTKDKYEGLLKSGGDNLKEFLVNLHLFHNRVAFIYPKLTPPEFRVSKVSERSLELHYFSKRVGLQEFVRGLIQGLGKFFETEVEIDLLASRNNGDDHEIFLIKWK
ncbi:MAG: heme NO-binding domain-containing protein, partial [Flavobacterium sp.]